MTIIGHGIDIVSVKRLREKIQNNPQMEERVFTAAELEYCKSKKDTEQYLAGRFAAKEAVYKAMSCVEKELYWQDIEVLTEDTGPVISGECTAHEIIKKHHLKYKLSISHEDDFAVASVVFWREEE
ncbi:MAG: holo-ACP synthase [Elusimicrobia bacterium]|nr:holo-ACP synthase [Elusimicrobiota bacterium]